MLKIPALIGLAVISIIQLILLDQIRTDLSSRHPEVFRTLMRKSPPTTFSPTGTTIAKFVWRRGDRDLKDAGLTRRVVASKLLYCILPLVFGACACVIFS